ncbi:MAG: hypothetical protein ISS76_14625 [Phycisphaerae bacterium]|nr:hypothetical protein [Phycisphaerae bacterium]
MILSRSAAVLTVTLLMFLVTPCLAQNPAQQERKAELERVLEKLREKAEDKTVLVQRESDKSTSQLRDFPCLRPGGFFRHKKALNCLWPL